MYEVVSDIGYIITTYIAIFGFLLFVGLIWLIFFIKALLKSSNTGEDKPVDERLELYMTMINPESNEEVLHHAMDAFLAKYGVLKIDEDMHLFTQYYPKIVAHPVIKKKTELLKRFITDLTKKNEAIHGKEFKKKLGL